MSHNDQAANSACNALCMSHLQSEVIVNTLHILADNHTSIWDMATAVKGILPAYLLLHAACAIRWQHSVSTAISKFSFVCRADGGNEAASMRIAEQYLTAFGGIAKAGNTLLLPASANDPASMVAQALSIYNNVSRTPLANPPR